MYQLGIIGKRWLKIFHLIFAGVWLGAGVSLMVMGIAAEVSGGIDMSSMLELSLAVDQYLVMPALIGVVITGLIYSFMTNWGFVKYYWVIVKWVLTIILVIIGVFLLTPESEFVAVLGNIQLVLMLFLFAISVLKPWGKRVKEDSKIEEKE